MVPLVLAKTDLQDVGGSGPAQKGDVLPPVPRSSCCNALTSWGVSPDAAPMSVIHAIDEPSFDDE
jgi:hypothetical protein